MPTRTAFVLLALLLLLGCSEPPTVPVARLCVIQADTSRITESGVEIVQRCR